MNKKRSLQSGFIILVLMGQILISGCSSVTASDEDIDHLKQLFAEYEVAFSRFSNDEVDRLYEEIQQQLEAERYPDHEVLEDYLEALYKTIKESNLEHYQQFLHDLAADYSGLFSEELLMQKEMIEDTEREDQ